MEQDEKNHLLLLTTYHTLCSHFLPLELVWVEMYHDEQTQMVIAFWQQHEVKYGD
jgi:hypothetical protein